MVDYTVKPALNDLPLNNESLSIKGSRILFPLST